MKLKKVLAISMVGIMTFSLAGCGSSSATATTEDSTADTAESTDAAADESADATEDSEGLSYANIKLGEDYTDITTTIKLLTHRTDMAADDYPGKNWDAYLAEFNKMYPNITVEVDPITDYSNEARLRVTSGDWGDIMMIDGVDKADLSTYFISYGSADSVGAVCNYANNWRYDDQIYGIPSTANAQGIVYNKKVFEAAGITEIPTTTKDFIADLQKIKDNTDAIPLYTNYAAQWTMGAWDSYSGAATADTEFLNIKLPHMSNPFADPGDGTGLYNVYKVLYDAVSDGLTEDDYTTTDWEGCKGMINNGEIGTMVLGSWAVSQMKAAGDNADDIGYMPFPMTYSDGKQYASAGPDYNFGINVNSSADNQAAAMVFVKWMTEESGFSYNEGGLPLKVGDTDLPDVYAEFTDVTFIPDEPATTTEEADLLNTLNADSELQFNNGGNEKVMSIVEHAANGDESFDDIMNDWNTAWSDAQETDGVEVTY